MTYAPPGYVLLHQSLENFANEAFAEQIAEIAKLHSERVAKAEREAKAIEDPVHRALASPPREPDFSPIMQKAINAFRDRLYGGQILTFYPDHAGKPIPIEPGYWATEIAGSALVTGRHTTFFGEAPIWVKANEQRLPPATVKPVRKRGPRPEKRRAVKSAMIAFGDMKSLAAMDEVAMSATFGASRDTCRKARDEVLSEFHQD